MNELNRFVTPFVNKQIQVHRRDQLSATLNVFSRELFGVYILGTELPQHTSAQVDQLLS